MPFFDGGHSGGSRSTTSVPVGISPQPFPSTGPAGNPVPFSGPLGQVGLGLPQSLGQPQPNWLSGVAGATSGSEDPLKKQQMGGMSAGV